MVIFQYESEECIQGFKHILKITLRCEMKTVLNYVGGRNYWVYNEVRQIIEKSKQNIKGELLYIEPFGGGFSLGLNLLENGIIEKAVYNDLDEKVYNFWQCLKEDKFRLIDNVTELIVILAEDIRIEHWLNALEKYEESEERFKRAAGEYIRRKYSIRYSYIKPRLITIDYKTFDFTDTLIKAGNLLENVEIYNENYVDLKGFDGDNTIWSCDPPFLVDNVDSYYRAEDGGFNHKKFKNFCESNSGLVIISYNKSEIIKELYNEENTLFLEITKHNRLKHGNSTEFLIVKNGEKFGVFNLEDL